MSLILNGFATVGVTTDKAGEHRRTVLSRSYNRTFEKSHKSPYNCYRKQEYGGFFYEIQRCKTVLNHRQKRN